MKHMKILTFSFLILAGGLFVACDNEEDTSTAVELLSFGPTGVQHGDQIVFIGNNLKKVTAIELPGITVDKAQFVEQSNDEIVLVVPDEAEEGHVTLKTTDGDIVSKSILSFEVVVTIETIPEEVKPGETMTITGEYVNWINEVWFTEDVMVDVFISKSVNELVLQVPMDAQTGPLVFITGGTEPDEIKSEEDLIVTLPSITSFTPTTVGHGEDITITGTNLDLVAGILFKGSDNAVTDFKSQNETQIVVTVPNYTNKGKISLVAFSGVRVESAVPLVIPMPPLEALGFVVFDDALKNGWSKWGGWGGGSSDINNSDNVREGNVGIKVVFGGDWGGPMQFGGNSSTSGFTKFGVSIYGGPGTNGKVVNLIVKGGATQEKQITLVEGEWTDYNFPLSTFGSPANITEMFFQDRGWSGTIYVDGIGLR